MTQTLTRTPELTEEQLDRVPDCEWTLIAIESTFAEMYAELDGSQYDCVGCTSQVWGAGIRPALQLTFRYADWTWVLNLCRPHTAPVQGEIELNWSVLADVRRLLAARRS